MSGRNLPLEVKRLHRVRLKFLFFSILCILCGFVLAEEFIYDSHSKKDPFSPPVINAREKVSKEVLKGVRIEGIIWDEHKPMAVINDKVVGVGDTVSSARIIGIRQNEVIFDVDGQAVSVKLKMGEGEEI